MNRKVKIILINLIVLMVFMEIAALSLFFIQNQKFFYLTKSRMAPGKFVGFTPKHQLTDIRLHPFFGYTHSPNQSGMNNFGFDCQRSFPYVKKERDMVIGIFGGSVAEGLYLNGRAYLTKELQQNPAFKDKDFVFLNFALGGFKQPQSLQILAYFLSLGQQFDMVILIDGFNEAIFCANNARLNVDISMPSAQHFLPLRDLIDQQTLTRARLQTIGHIASLQEKINEQHEKMKRVWLAFMYYWNFLWEKRLNLQYNQAILKFDNQITPFQGEESLLNVKYTHRPAQFSLLQEESAALWARSALIMNHMLAGFHIPFFHFLQPNQYFSQKKFSAEEKIQALSSELPYQNLVSSTYPYFLRQIVELNKNGVNSYDATAIFDSEKGTIYSDNCCHYNKRGYEIFDGIISSRIFLDLKNRTK
jgi:hypothetical protein